MAIAVPVIMVLGDIAFNEAATRVATDYLFNGEMVKMDSLRSRRTRQAPRSVNMRYISRSSH